MIIFYSRHPNASVPRRIGIVFACILYFAVMASSACATDVYIVAGQSNGWRISSLADVPGKTDEHKIYYFPMECVSRPTTATLRVLESLNPSAQGSELAAGLLRASGGDIVFVQYSVCGSSLYGAADWYPGDDPENGKVNNDGIYASFLHYMADARSQIEKQGLTWELKGIFWHQGESDANEHASAYADNLRHLFTRFRQDLGANVPIVAGHIRDLNEASKAVNRAMDTVAAEDPSVAVVPTNDLTFESETDVHINTQGCHEFGRRLVEAYEALKARDAKKDK